MVVEAEQFFPDKPLPFNKYGLVVCFDDWKWCVETARGQKAFLAPGDWIILEEPKDGFRAYPCKPDIFEKIYEKFTEWELIE